MTQKGPTRRINSVDNTCDIIEAMWEQGGCTVTELTKEVNLTVGTTHTYLKTLQDRGYVMQKGSTYVLGPRFILLGDYTMNHNSLFSAGKDVVDELAAETGEAIHLVIEHMGQLLVLYESFGSDAVSVDYHTQRRGKLLNHLHCTACGKAILAELSDGRVDEIVRTRGLEDLTVHTITERDALFEDLKKTRERGYAINNQEQIPGVRAVGVAIKTQTDELIGAISLTAPKSRLKDEMLNETVPQKLLSASNIIEIKYQTHNMSGKQNI